MTELNFFKKCSRLRTRLREAEWRRYGTILLMGKLSGIGLLLLAAYFWDPNLLGSVAFAADPVVKGNDIVNPLNTVWTLVAAFLVFGMQVGFTMLEAGFCRSRETVNVLMECIVDTCLCGLLFFAFGFAFMFSHGNGFIGMNWFFLKGAPATYETSGVAFLAFWLFQFAFADTCSTITSGAMIGRTDLSATWFIALLCRASSIRSSGTGLGDRTASWPRWALPVISSLRSGPASTISPVRRWFTPSAAWSRWRAPSCSVHALGASSSGTAADL